MLTKLVENWLNSSTEREFELPFRQLLIDEGKCILHASTHGQLELGKDIYALAQDGALEAYQLKTGPVTQGEWSRIRSQVTQLVEVPVEHPRVGVRLPDRAVVVSNGAFSDSVIEEISRLNVVSSERGYARLDLVSGDELLQRLSLAQSTVIPMEPASLRQFLTFWTQDGRRLVDKAALAQTLDGLLRLRDAPVSSADAKRRITGSVLMSAYALHPFSEARNHVAVSDGWTLVAAYVLAAAARWALDADHWRPSFSLVLDAALDALASLADEVKSRERYHEGSPEFEGEGFYQFRTTMVAGRLASLSLVKSILNGSFSSSEVLDAFLSTQEEHLLIWGEGAIPDLTLLALYSFLSGNQLRTTKLAGSMLDALATANAPRQIAGIANPYWDCEHVWRLRHDGVGLDPGEESESFSGSSYTLRCVVLLAARLGVREPLDKLWRAITHVAHEEFLPDEPWMEFLWKADSGELRQRRFRKTESWSRLCEEARSDGRQLPHPLADAPWFLPLFLCAYPHRLRWTMLSALLARMHAAGLVP